LSFSEAAITVATIYAEVYYDRNAPAETHETARNTVRLAAKAMKQT